MNKHMFVPALLAAGLLKTSIVLANPTACAADQAHPGACDAPSARETPSKTACTPDQVHPGNCDGLRGQIADDSATFTADPGENSEFKTSLDGLAGPSHVAQRDLQAMHDSAASLPTQQAARTETLSDADLGALGSRRDPSGPGDLTRLPVARRHGWV